MVLNDGETFTDVSNCFIMEIPAEMGEIDEIEQHIDASGGDDYVVRFDVNEYGQLKAYNPAGGMIGLA